jgi:hypothetical protein
MKNMEFVKFHEISSNLMKFDEILWKLKKIIDFNEISYNLMKFDAYGPGGFECGLLLPLSAVKRR